MKATTSYTLCACLFLSLCITGNVFAQTAVNKAALFSTAIKNDDVNKYNSAEVNIKVQKAFMRQFGEATSQSWSMAGRNFLSQSYVNGIRTNALFNKGGYLIYSIMYGTEKEMPANLRTLVKGGYPDYAITMATKINQDNRNIWVVQLQNPQEVVTVRMEDGEMEQVQQYNKLK